jgi:type I restriction enzyme S subunit
MGSKKLSKTALSIAYQESNTRLKTTKFRQIPEEWNVSTIGESCLVENRLRKPINAETRSQMQGSYPYYGPTGIVDHINEYQIEGKYVLIGEDGDHFLKYQTWSMTQLVEGRFNVNNHAHVLQGIGDCSTEWLFYFFKHRNIVPHLTRQGAGRYKLNKATLLELNLLIPPLPEQKKIVEILSSVDEAIASTQAVIDQTRKVKQGLLQKLLTRGIGHTRFKESAIGKIPEVWEVVHLIEHITLPTGQIDPKQSPYKKLPLIAPNHIESVTGRLLEKVSAEAQGAISGKYLFQEGDVIYSKIRPYLRKATLAKEKGLCSADMYPLRVKDTLLPRFLLALVLSEDFSRFAESKSMRTGIPKLNREELGEYICALPPVNEQKKMVSLLESIDQDIETNLQSIVSLEILKRGLMQDLLTGKVRVGCTR